MRKVIVPIFALALCVNVAFAQAGLGSGQRIAAPSVNPEKQVKTCPHCGIRISGVTHPSDHHEWCPYYRPAGGGARYVGYTQEQAAMSVAATVAGVALANWLFSEPINKKPTAQDYATGKNMQKEMRVDEQFWKVGDYEVVRGDLRLGEYKKRPNAYAYGIKNTSTGKFISNPNEQNKKDIKDGTVVVFRDVESTDIVFGTPGSQGHIRLFRDPDGAFNGKPLIGLDAWDDTYVFNKNKWQKAQSIKGYLPSKECALWFQIDENDELKRLNTLNYTPAKGCNSFQYPEKGKHFVLIDKNGKQGLYYAYMNEVHKDGKWELIHEAGKVVPIACDMNTIERVTDEKIGAYYTCKANGKDVAYLNAELFNPNVIKAYDSVTVKQHNDFGTLLFVKKNKQWGALLPNGQVIMPLTTGRDEVFWANMDIYVQYSYTSWLRKQVNNLLKKGKYEKQADYEARMKDQATIQNYLAQKLNGMSGQYLQEKAPTDGRVFKPLNYDSEREVFTGNFYWNKYEIPVPIREAEAFEKAFDQIVKPALQTAKYRILNDVIAIDDITFTMPNGKKYHGRIAE